MKKTKGWTKWLTAFIFAIAVIAVYKTFDSLDVIWEQVQRFLNVLSPFFVGFVIAYLLYFPCSKLEKLYGKVKLKLVRKNARGLSVLSVYLVLLLIVVLILSFALPAISKNIADFIAKFPEYYEQAKTFIAQLNLNDRFGFTVDLDTIFSLTSIQKLFSSVNLSDIGKYAQSILGMSSVVLNTFLAVVTSIYIMLDRRSLRKIAMQVASLLIPEKQLNLVVKYVGDINHYFSAFIYCQAMDALILGSVATIGLSLMGVQYATILGPLLGLFNMIPYFGAIIMSIIAIVIIVFTDGFGAAVAAGIFLIVSQQLDGNILQPKLLSGALKFSPLWVILGITVGGAYFGVWGMIIAIPVVALLKTIILDIINYKKRHQAEKLVEIQKDDFENQTSSEDVTT